MGIRLTVILDRKSLIPPVCPGLKPELLRQIAVTLLLAPPLTATGIV